MLQRFGTDTIPTHFVKYLVEQNEIPMIPFTKKVLHVVNGRSYIHNNYIVRCKKSGFTPQITSLNESTYFDFIEPYIFGRRYAGLTSKYLSRTRYYDSETHNWLGNYLRAYKAVYDINLMYYYNCFSNEYCQKISIKLPTDTYKYYKLTNQNLENETYKIISVPIKFCQKYTVAIQSEEGALFIPAFVGPLGLLDKQQSLLQDYINTCLTSQLDDCEYTSITDFKQPITYFNKPFIFQSPCFGNEERER